MYNKFLKSSQGIQILLSINIDHIENLNIIRSPVNRSQVKILNRKDANVPLPQTVLALVVWRSNKVIEIVTWYNSAPHTV